MLWASAVTPLNCRELQISSDEIAFEQTDHEIFTKLKTIDIINVINM